MVWPRNNLWANQTALLLILNDFDLIFIRGEFVILTRNHILKSPSHKSKAKKTLLQTNDTEPVFPQKMQLINPQLFKQLLPQFVNNATKPYFFPICHSATPVYCRYIEYKPILRGPLKTPRAQRAVWKQQTLGKHPSRITLHSTQATYTTSELEKNMSSTISAMNLGIQGINKGMDGLRKNAHDIATANKYNDVTGGNPEQAPGVNDVTDSLVGMTMNKLQVEMSAKVVQTGVDMIGTLIDIKA